MTAKDSITGSAGTIKTLVEGLVKYGVKRQAVEEITGIQFDRLTDPDVRVPIENMVRLAKNVRQLTGMPSIGLSLGSDPAVIYPSGIGWGIMVNSQSLIEGIRQFARYTRIISEFLVIELVREEKLSTILFKVAPPDYYTSFSMEVVLCRFLTTVRQILKKEINPTAARFQHAQPSYGDEYHRIFGPAVLFDQSECALVFPTELLEFRMTHHDPYLMNFLTQHAEKLLARLSADESFGKQVKRVIINQLYSGQVDVEMVSETLNVSRSTLFRKLKEENVTFKKMLRDTRAELARHYLIENKMPISEIAFLLGFSDSSSFNRAFKSWEKQTPIQFRMSQTCK